MSPKSLLRIIIVLALVLPVQALADQNGTSVVTWMHADFPPFHIIDGPYAGQGPSDMIHDLMRRELPDFEHVVITANLRRTFNWMENGENVLAVGIISTPERRKSMLFSMPCTMTPPVSLVVRAGEEGALLRQGRVSLREFVSSHRLGVATDRSYGAELDAVLNPARGGGNIVVNSGPKLFDSLMGMLLLKRVDGVLAYPFEAVYVARMKGEEGKIALVPLDDAMVPVMGCIAAPRTAWGSEMIARVNEVLRRHRPEPEYRRAFERWLTPGSVEGYRALYEDFLRTE